MSAKISVCFRFVLLLQKSVWLGSTAGPRSHVLLVAVVEVHVPLLILVLQRRLKDARLVDDRLVYAINTNVPTESFISTENADDQCHKLQQQVLFIPFLISHFPFSMQNVLSEARKVLVVCC